MLAYDPVIYNPCTVFHSLGGQRRHDPPKETTKINQPPPTVAGVFLCPGQLLQVSARITTPAAAPPGCQPSSSTKPPRPDQARRLFSCPGQNFSPASKFPPLGKILVCGQNFDGQIFSSRVSSTMTSAYFSSRAFWSTSSPRGFPGTRVTSCLSV